MHQRHAKQEQIYNQIFMEESFNEVKDFRGTFVRSVSQLDD